MRKIAIAIATSAALLAAPAIQAKPKLTPQQQLDKLIALQTKLLKLAGHR